MTCNERHGGADTLRIDRLLVYLRFARTRSAARAMIEAGHMRVNSVRLLKASREVSIGDVITLAWHDQVVVARVERLPKRRLPPADASRSWTRLA